MPLLSISRVLLASFGFVRCCRILVPLKDIPVLVCLNRFVNLLILGLHYVKVVLFFRWLGNAHPSSSGIHTLPCSGMHNIPSSAMHTFVCPGITLFRVGERKHFRLPEGTHFGLPEYIPFHGPECTPFRVQSLCLTADNDD